MNTKSYKHVNLEISISKEEYEWIEKYAQEHKMSLQAVIRHCIRVGNLVENTENGYDVLKKFNPLLRKFILD